MSKHIDQTCRRRFITTFSLVGLDNLLLLVYPAFGGWTINAVVEGNVWQIILYSVVALLMRTIGATRRIADTCTFTQIYTEIAVPIVLEQRKREVPHSTITARVALSREFVSFFEKHPPIATTSLVSIFGACMMLLILKFWVGVLAVATLVLFLWLLPRFAATSESLYLHSNNRLERDNHLIRDGNEHQLYRYYGWVTKLHALTSNREVLGYPSTGMTMSILFGFAFVHMAPKNHGSIGHIYSVSAYLWMFAMSSDDASCLVEQYSNLKGIRQRVELSKENNLSKAV